MAIFKKLRHTAWLLLVFIALSACEKDIVATFDVNDVNVRDKNLVKFKSKSAKQYISILYTDLFKQAISVDQLVRTERVIESVGDKGLVHEIIVSNYMNAPGVTLPSDSFMRNNLDTFIMQTYRKFYLRIPSELEKSFFRNFITANPNVTTEMVYVAFASSDEYLFY